MKKFYIVLLLILPTILFAQAPVVPLDGTSGVSQATASVSWTDFNDLNVAVPDYDVELSTTGVFGGEEVVLVVAGLSAALPVLSYNTTYYWRVRDTDTDGGGANGPWSATFTFTTAIANPVLTFPLNGATNVPLLPDVTWTFAGGTTGVTFDVELSTDGGGTWSNVVTGLVGTSTNYQFLSSLIPNGSYVVRIRAKKAGEADKTSSENAFTTNTMSPANYATGISVLPTFTWTGGSGPYTLTVSVNSNFSSPVISEVVTSPHTRTYTTTASVVLANATIYYWKITEAGPTTIVQGEFTTVTESKPIITTINPSGTSATAYWFPYPYSSGLKYDLLRSTASSMTGYSTVSDLTDTYYTITGLTPGTTYYIQVRSKNSAGTVINSYSSVSSFTMPGLPTPYASYPTGSVTNYFNPPTLYWYLGAYYTGLTFVVKYWRDGEAEPGVLPTAQTATGGYFHTASTDFYNTLTATLTAGALYHWKVASTNDGGTTLSSFSTTADFYVYSSTPTSPIVPYPSWPTGGATVYMNPPTFYWYLGQYATGLEYKVEWDDTFDLTSPLGDSGWITDLYYTLATSLPAENYFWRVKSRLAAPPNTESAWSSIASFTIPSSTSTVPTPIPTYPTGGVTVYTLSPTLMWFASSSSTLEYRVKYSPYPNVDGSGVLNHATVTTSSWSTSSSLGLSGLTAGTTYYWQVQSRLQSTPASVSSWSSVVSFTTAAGATAIVPLIGSPNYGQPINNTSAVLSWIIPTQGQVPLVYDVEYSKSQDFSNAVNVANINKPFLEVNGLDANSIYYWRVTSKTVNGSKSIYSATGSFRTNSVTDVKPIDEIPSNFVLHQNYPNPFNPTTRITFSLPENSFVSLKIYDMLGREIKTLVGAEVTAGNHSVEWNGTDYLGKKVASGTYIYRITAGNFISVKKMLLVK